MVLAFTIKFQSFLRTGMTTGLSLPRCLPDPLGLCSEIVTEFGSVFKHTMSLMICDSAREARQKKIGFYMKKTLSKY